MSRAALHAHLATGTTTVCRAWSVVRTDAVAMGFTDHDRGFSFEGVDFRPGAGMTAAALEQTTGLSVDNTEAMGILSDAAITEADIEAGRYDGAGVRAWVVNWQDVTQRELRFSGTIGEMRRGGGAFHADLRGLTEALNQPLGRVYQRGCDAVLGDGRCGVDLGDAAFAADATVLSVGGGRVFAVSGLGDFADGWFTRGQIRMTEGAGAGLSGLVREDRHTGGAREIELWEPIRAEVLSGQAVRLVAGCDKRAATCREKFHNLGNFRGFPHLPSEDWLMSVPMRAGDTSGGSMNR